MNPIPYGRQHITDDDINAVANVLRGPFLTQGPHITAFESAFAAYIGCQYAVAVANGTAALHLACMALGVTEGTRVITTPITFSASANCIRYCGGEVYFADIDPKTAVLDIHAVRSLLEQHPKGYFSGIIPVDFAGYPVDLAEFRALADEYGLWILEDACHAPGGSFTDPAGTVHRCGDGSLAELAIFSFHPVKHIAAGEGGMITTNDEGLYKHLLRLRTHGITNKPDELVEPYLGEPERGGWYMQLQELGYNYRLTDMQAALGMSQLNRADSMMTRRQEIAKRYDEAFAGTGVTTIEPPANGIHAYHLYVIQVDDRKGLYDFLRTKQIMAQVHYIPVHLMPYYRQFGWKPGDFPKAEHYYARCLSLPMFPTLTDAEQEYVIACVNEFMGL
ncbi:MULTISPECIES: UDP-4-amino-4,6-dideoxy-N-acetyl-beta-L-altrosamine transaminase [unclassified Spirosoma]|mgnify:CR=1 FL=1|uniref:UDP-4-amino-4, 6-dideoxy-N-acetyl-beta-L-altrosamine transaminase n=1 Tax=unclassified Spirosoma TaxID=2621999 RepID=UPI000963AE4B|nr:MULTISPECIES: UDP-4-amino-4,6-dideoxy-N-acetyl-beta-L-altrosamine transaminase [unclassified Spirosoma]MBN8825814.1 UDP-4-amino-4,6-dideoxy-N-acetyl-beta-L-altrosamine transaminase [Spirosoma sp.]OJW74403.1 MAG: UDP-4-amino-4,6-dideoxy-N-acetyl-beta-L-altrosamine transaminase [Spirosoma sp. 48-14]